MHQYEEQKIASSAFSSSCMQFFGITLNRLLADPGDTIVIHFLKRSHSLTVQDRHLIFGKGVK